MERARSVASSSIFEPAQYFKSTELRRNRETMHACLHTLEGVNFTAAGWCLRSREIRYLEGIYGSSLHQPRMKIAFRKQIYTSWCCWKEDICSGGFRNALSRTEFSFRATLSRASITYSFC